MVNKAQENFNKQYQSQNPFNQGNSQGKASDSQTPNKESQNFKANPTKQIGDYIDYEEVE